ncbi:MAG: MmcQ/YjbR family DNA-binding protein [Sphingosinicella sp.]
MSQSIDSWDDAAGYALSLPGTELSTSYGKPAVKVNGRAFLFWSHEADSSFGIGIDMDSVDILMETDPDTFWQTPHYQGWPAVLIRFGSQDQERVRLMIERAHEQAAAKPRPRARNKA